MRSSFFFCLVASALLLAGSVTRARGQVAVPIDPVLSAYQTEQQSLAQERRALIANGSTEEQLQAWRQQNASRFAAQEQRAEAMAAASALAPRPSPPPAAIPADASPTYAAFLKTRATLAQVRAQVRSQAVQALPAGATAAQIERMQSDVAQYMQAHYAAQFKLQAARAKILAVESEQTILPSPSLRIPPNASSQMIAYLTLRNQLAGQRIQLRNQYVTSDPAVRQAALQQWRQQNAGLLQQLRQEAEALAPGSASTPNN